MQEALHQARAETQQREEQAQLAQALRTERDTLQARLTAAEAEGARVAEELKNVRTELQTRSLEADGTGRYAGGATVAHKGDVLPIDVERLCGGVCEPMRAVAKKSYAQQIADLEARVRLLKERQMLPLFSSTPSQYSRTSFGAPSPFPRLCKDADARPT